jgi:uncharacterized membrane protein
MTEAFRDAFVRGLAILLPLVVTLLVISIVLGFIANAISPLVTAIVGFPGFESRTLVTILTLAVFAAIVVVIGLAAEHGTHGNRLRSQMDAFIGSIPGVGSIYTGFNEVSELLLDSDTDSFQDVKLVEYPMDGSYVVAFKTAETAEQISEAVGSNEMVTLFMPMAPNPVMGGFVIHVERDRVVDIDLTVEEGVRSIVTSGVAVGSGASETGPLDGELERIADAEYVDGSEIRRTGTESVVSESRFEDERTKSPSGESNGGEP